MKSLFIYYFLFITCFIVYAQNSAQLTNHFQIKSFYNPAFCGNNDAFNFTILARQQWIGYENAPSTQIITFDTYLKNIKCGIGFSAINDALGNENTLGCKLNYCYKFFVSRSTLISAGIGAGILNKSFNAVTLVYEELDPNGIYNSYSTYMPEFNTGFMISHKLLSLGTSISKTYDNPNDDVEITIPYYLHTLIEYSIPVNSKISIVPAFYWHKTIKLSTFDIGNSIIINEKVWAGLAYRLMESVNGKIGYQLSKKIKIGYSYDFSLGGLRTYNTGSHEVYLKFSIPKTEKQIFYLKSPRFF